MVKDREGKLLSKEDEARKRFEKRWQEHFMEVLNRPGARFSKDPVT